jgi:hypothetical protein
MGHRTVKRHTRNSKSLAIQLWGTQKAVGVVGVGKMSKRHK